MATGSASTSTGTATGTGNAIWNDAKETARSKLSEQQRAAAGSLGDFAGALRKSAQELQGGQHQSAARFAQTAANSLDQFSQSLKNRDIEGMLRDAESFARRQPAAFFGAAVVAGFFAVRFLKSSNRDTGGQPAQSPSFPTNEI